MGRARRKLNEAESSSNTSLGKKSAKQTEKRAENYQDIYLSKETLEKYLNVVAEIVVLLDDRGRIVMLNDSGHRLLGYEPGELIGKDWFDTCILPRMRETMRKIHSSLMKGDAEKISDYENPVITRSGEERIILWHNTVISRGELGVVGTLSSGEDITERKMMERKLKAVNRLYAFLSDINQTIVRTKDPYELYRAVCRIAVVTGNFRMAWIGLLDEESGDIIPFCHHGHEEGFLSIRKINIRREQLADIAPTVKVYVSGEVVIIQDLLDYASADDLKAAAEKRGYRSMAAVPLRLRGKVIGNLTLYAEEPGFFTDEERRLLEEIGTDISYALDAIEAERQREQISRLWEHLVNSLPVGIYILKNRKFQMVNPAFCHITGYSAEELRGRDALALVHPEDRDAVQKSAIEMLKDKRQTPYEYRVICKDGEIKWISEQVVSVEYMGGLAAIGSFMDITEKKKSELLLKESEERYRLLAENAQDLIYRIRLYPERKFEYVSPSATFITGYTPEEHYADPDLGFKLVHPDDIPLLARIGKSPQDFQRPVELRWIKKDGSVIWTEQRNVPIYDEEGRLVAIEGIARDITARRKAEEERREMERQAHLISRLASIGEMAAGIAHEINNPLTGVIGYAQLLMERDDVPQDIKNDVERINEGARRVSQIVHRLLSFARQTKPEKRYVDINELIKSTIALREYSLKVNDIEVITSLDVSLPRLVADPGQIQQVLLNLIVNAETEMKLAHGGGKLTITTEKVGDNKVAISVSDNGPGIKPEIIGRIFDPFFTTRDVGQGTGLGLSLCWGIVAEHGGNISVKSEPGKGATFIVELPVVQQTEFAEDESPKIETSEPVKIKARILIIDDEQVVRDFLTRLLVKDGFEVETADNARDGLEKIKNNRYNLILLDIRMPGMDGIALFREIKNIAESLARRVIFITGDMLDPDTSNFIKSNNVAYLAKPFSAEEIRQEVSRALERG